MHVYIYIYIYTYIYIYIIIIIIVRFVMFFRLLCFSFQVPYDNPLAANNSFSNDEHMRHVSTAIFAHPEDDRDGPYAIPLRSTAPASESSYAIPRVQPMPPASSYLDNYESVSLNDTHDADDRLGPDPWEQRRQNDLRQPDSLYPEADYDSSAPRQRYPQYETSHSRPISFPGEYDIHSPVTGGIRVLPPVSIT